MSNLITKQHEKTAHLDEVLHLVEEQISRRMDGVRARGAWERVISSVPAEYLAEALATALSRQRYQVVDNRRR